MLLRFIQSTGMVKPSTSPFETGLQLNVPLYKMHVILYEFMPTWFH